MANEWVTIKESGLTELGPRQERKFQEEYSRVSRTLGLSPNPDDPQHFYDYRGLFKETGHLGVGPQKHFPSKFKLAGHPNLIVGGIDTRTGQIVSDEEEAVKLANALPYGLTASVWTKNIEKAEKIARELEAGTVGINRTAGSNNELPWGGVKQSGLGRALSKYGIREFTNMKVVMK